ncbi:D-isomer specific 2-hydroxyacid dehydrogenase family protein [Tenggerimyces flavus]|uniref:D-isomer specific 2-hydroxyacid dehydrogenase family protein n=1 Tax=Tenggerimyces flavus TaxID=1708749 RepID=A0ABV7Y701_9ACTN|nr:D-isomer specific 2-hydroxyacid dehydrogenase family protein [Tenggerimyces flavus]MBM7785495.1 phosphoglycerate dehydrogenase-like enzyme [Tenggerimyces flavus]
MTTTKIYITPEAPAEVFSAAKSVGADLVSSPAEASGLVWFGHSPASLAEVLHPGVRWVQLPSAGVEGWLSSGVLVAHPSVVFTSATGSYADQVAEHALALMLSLARQVPALARTSTWEWVSSASLYGAVVGVVGAGGIGQELIRLLAPFRCRVLAVRRSGVPVSGASETLTPDALDRVLAESDFVVIGAPATSETQHLIGARELALMQPHAYLVNIARGSLIDTTALVAALAAGSIAGAGLDVTDPEPLPDGHPLWSEPRALITPHSANPTHMLYPALARRVADNITHFTAGKPLLGVVDPSRGY